MKDKIKLGPVVDPDTGERLIARKKTLDDGAEVPVEVGTAVPLDPESEKPEGSLEVIGPPDKNGWIPVQEGGKGSPKVASRAYREGWDRIFGGRDEDEEIDEWGELPPDKSKLN